jgi:acetyl-CoA synthetase
MPAEEASGHAIETLLLEQRRYRPSAEFAAHANAQPEIYRRGFEEFWREEGSSRVSWFEPFDRLKGWEPPYARW